MTLRASLHAGPCGAGSGAAPPLRKLLLLTLLLLAPSSAFAQDVSELPPTPTAPGLRVHEWVILVVDPNWPQVNAMELFNSTLPDIMSGRRPAHTEPEQRNVPMPIGLMRFFGEAADDTRLDVLLQVTGGELVAHHPRGQAKGDRMLWKDLQPLHTPPSLDTLPRGHWTAALREADSLYLHRDRRGEQFLLYDVQFKYAAAVQIKQSDESQVQVANAGPARLSDLVLYRPSPDGWRVGHIDEVQSQKTQPPAAPKPAQPEASPAPDQVFDQPTNEPSPNPDPATPVPVGPDPADPTEATPPAQPDANATTSTIALSAPISDPQQALQPWRDRLTQLGLINADLDLILTILEEHALSSNRLTAIYRFDPAEMDRLLPLEIVPQPAEIVRVGLVIVRNIDPAIMQEIDQLIAQLGDDDWSTRESAEKRLAELGAAAKPKLNQALKDKDLERVYRAERLVEALQATPAEPAE